MFEVEVKARISNYSSAITTLDNIGAIYLQDESHNDQVFGLAKQFPPSDGGIIARIREQQTWKRREKGKRSAKSVLEFKEIYRSKGGLEIPFEIDGETDPYIFFLEKLGFKLMFTVQKQRTLFQYDECEVAIDAVEDLGIFAEVEIRTPEEKKLEVAQIKCSNILDHLFPDGEVVYQKYGDMIWEKKCS